jgi:hypothetical protein
MCYEDIKKSKKILRRERKERESLKQTRERKRGRNASLTDRNTIP